jgi:hypothetical protein
VNLIADTWRQLVRRRLWPLAVLLLAAVVAVPFVLAKEPPPVVAPPPPAPEKLTAAEEAATGDPVVALASEADRSRRRRVLGARKDPFAVAPAPKPKKADEDPGAGQQAPEIPGVTVPLPPADPSGGAGPADVAPPVGYPPVVTPPVGEPTDKPKKKTYPPDSLIVRFGDATSGTLTRSTLEKLQALPEGEDEETQAVLVYVGLTKDRKSAIFMVDAAAEVTGDGECKPHPSNCETIHLREGETEFFDLEDEEGTVVAQYQLDLVQINARKKS